MSGIYHQALLDHARRPRNQASVAGAQQQVRSSNPLCGDELVLGLDWKQGRLERVVFRGRGCAVCLASASLLTEAAAGGERRQLRGLLEGLRAWWQGQDALPAGLEPLQPLQGNAGRERCVMLAWEALDEALGRCADATVRA